MAASDGTISVESMHGKAAQDWLGLGTAELLAKFAEGGKEGTAAAMELARRKHNRAIRKRQEA